MKIEVRNRERIKLLNRTTRANMEVFKKKRRMTSKICRGKKREFENRKLRRMGDDGENKRIKEFYTTNKIKKDFNRIFGSAEVKMAA